MKYKYIPKPTIEESQEIRPLYRIADGVMICGWEIGHMTEAEEGQEQEWVKDCEVMELSPKEESEWEWEQEHQAPTQLDKIEAQTMYTALMTDTLIEGESDV